MFVSLETPDLTNILNNKFFQTCQLPIDKSYLANKGFRGRPNNTPLLWGNGRDWRCPAADEGDWGRIYPLGAPNLQKDGFQTEAQVKAVVLDVTRFTRAAKQASVLILKNFLIIVCTDFRK